MSQNFNMKEFAKEVVYGLRSIEGRKTFRFDSGHGHVTADQQAVIQSMVDDSTWDREGFDTALVRANREFTEDLLAGNLDIATLPEGERDIAEAIDLVRQTGNDDLLESAKGFFEVGLEAEIDAPNTQFNKPENFGTGGDGSSYYIIATNASWVGGSQNKARAITSALEGDFGDDDKGLNRYANSAPYGQGEKTVKMAAKAFKAEAKEHIEATAPKVGAKTGLSAAAKAAILPNIQ